MFAVFVHRDKANIYSKMQHGIQLMTYITFEQSVVLSF